MAAVARRHLWRAAFLSRSQPTAPSSLIRPALRLPTRPPPRFVHTRLHSSSPAPRAQIVELGKPQSVSVVLPSGETSSFHYVWLRDHCMEPRSCHPITKQRLVDTALIPPDLHPAGVRVTDDGLVVDWRAEAGEKEGYFSTYPYEFLAEHAYDPPLEGHGEKPTEKVMWTKEIGKDPPMVGYEEVMNSEEGVYEWLKRIDIYGFCFVNGLPPTPEATEALVRRIAFIRETHYGAFWDFTADLAHGDLAYSEHYLRAHTDTTYFTDPCGLQLFHLLSPLSSHTGGHNLLVDGFRAASLLGSSHPASYALLSSLPIPSHASGSGSLSLPSGVHMSPLLPQPVFTHSPIDGELVQVRWNGDDRGVIGGKGWTAEKVEGWFEALRAWEAVLRSEEAELWTVMEPGTAIIFDNYRVLHGRSGFSGERRLCGAYVAGDDYRSRLKGLRKQFGRQE